MLSVFLFSFSFSSVAGAGAGASGSGSIAGEGVSRYSDIMARLSWHCTERRVSVSVSVSVSHGKTPSRLCCPTHLIGYPAV